ncbi:hypothetical protein SY83_05590 [Paenibacillus swuensis]|uniref:Uncharacterized protein n=1 Tax=Paenibacillus swuensis TaxID=1178515 RepID=A0A172TG35_9BACL|nr:hypothetical protein [Paenibacillus swuensis]ANE45864.1 hypothetical protein SY83_05590 [Paenibacillus swuensis]
MKLEDQELLFSLFHDGSIRAIERHGNKITFSVDILYLAERINSSYEYFEIVLNDTLEFYFEDSESNEITTQPQGINKLELEILKTELIEEKIKIFCSANNGCLFGFLIINAKDIRVLDPKQNNINLKVLEVIAKNYWEEFGHELS